MLEKLLDMGTGIYILWGIGLFGLLLKMIAGTYLNGMLRASENMSTTKKKSLRILRQKYENGRNLGINNGSGQSFTEKNIRGLKLIAMPLEFWRRSGQLLACVVCMMMAGAFLYYDVTWRGSPEMVTYLANGVLVCAFLLALENIFLINNKVEMLKANVRDYLENLTPARSEKNRAAISPGIRVVHTAQDQGEREKTLSSHGHRQTKSGRAGRGSAGGRTDEPAAADSESAVTKDTSQDAKSMCDVSAPSVYDERASNVERQGDAQSNEEVLNSFLREFFS
ncbi:MAG: hypothetical protein ACI39Q_04385 [Wujia sp.]